MDCSTPGFRDQEAKIQKKIASIEIDYSSDSQKRQKKKKKKGFICTLGI